MSEENPLIKMDFGDLSKPVTVLIEKISDAVGGWFRPAQIKRIAQAEVEAEKIRVVNGIEISEIQERALVRMLHREEKRQKNIERITTVAIEDLRADAKPENMENDWLSHFFDKCQLVSDAEMQSLWGRLLAGEANHPGTFSRRTVELVSTLDKTDAMLFTNLCKFAWSIGEQTPLIFDQTVAHYSSQGITFGALTHLDDIGLATFNNFTNFLVKDLPKYVLVNYYGRTVGIEFSQQAGNHLNVGKVLLTKVGKQLASICGSTPAADDFFNYACETWKGFGYKLSILS